MASPQYRKHRKRPCSICGRWYQPQAKVAHRQKTCLSPECQRLLRQKTNRRWRQRNPDYDCAVRLKAVERLDSASASSSPATAPEKRPHIPVHSLSSPLNQIPWDLIAEEVPGAFAIHIMLQVVIRWWKDELSRQTTVIAQQNRKVRGIVRQDELGSQSPEIFSENAKVLPSSDQDEMEEAGDIWSNTS